MTSLRVWFLIFLVVVFLAFILNKFSLKDTYLSSDVISDPIDYFLTEKYYFPIGSYIACAVAPYTRGDRFLFEDQAIEVIDSSIDTFWSLVYYNKSGEVLRIDKFLLKDLDLNLNGLDSPYCVLIEDFKFRIKNKSFYLN